VERALASYGVAAIAVLCVVLLIGSGRRFRWLAIVPAIALPAGFVADSFYWLYRFGHHLNPRAPLRLPSFTPEMFGNGTIGQFMTFAHPEPGFWLAVSAVALLGVAVHRRGKTCAECARRFTCSAVCSGALEQRTPLDEA
jgi:hypothetical protein